MKVTTDSCAFGAWAAKEIQNSQGKNLLDIGTGTGLLTLMIAQKNPAISFHTVEIDAGASHQALENFEASPWSDRIHLTNQDIRSFSFAKKYDFVVSNPPFYENELKSPSDPKRLAQHEGLKLEELFQVIKKLLSSSGKFYILLPYKRRNELEELLKRNNLVAEKITLLRPSPSHEPIRIILSGNNRQSQENKVAMEEIVIKEGDEYTKQFEGLLKDYYLKL